MEQVAESQPRGSGSPQDWSKAPAKLAFWGLGLGSYAHRLFCYLCDLPSHPSLCWVQIRPCREAWGKMGCRQGAMWGG